MTLLIKKTQAKRRNRNIGKENYKKEKNMIEERKGRDRRNQEFFKIEEKRALSSVVEVFGCGKNVTVELTLNVDPVKKMFISVDCIVKKGTQMIRSLSYALSDNYSRYEYSVDIVDENVFARLTYPAGTKRDDAVVIQVENELRNEGGLSYNVFKTKKEDKDLVLAIDWGQDTLSAFE